MLDVQLRERSASWAGAGVQPRRRARRELPQVPDPEQAKRIVEAAHRVCPYSNATRGNIEVTLTANGEAVV